MGHLHVADPAAVNEVNGLPHAGHAAALRAHLADAAELPRPLRDHPPLLHVVAARLLDVHIFAGLHGPHRHHGVPVVGSGDRDDVDVFGVEQPAEVLLEAGLPRQSLKLGGPLLEARRVAVGEGDELRVGIGDPLADVRLAAAEEAHHGHAELVVGADRGRGSGRADGLGGEPGAGDRGAGKAECSFDEMTTGESHEGVL